LLIRLRNIPRDERLAALTERERTISTSPIHDRLRRRSALQSPWLLQFRFSRRRSGPGGGRAARDASDRPNRIFQVTLEAARQAGLVGRRRVLDSTALYDAVATMDTVTLIRSAIRGLLKTADAGLGTTLRAMLRRDDDCVRAGKPSCDWDDETARGELVDALARDAHALLAVLDGRQVAEPVAQAAALLPPWSGRTSTRMRRGCSGSRRGSRRIG
jgi:hypothetical protein